MPYLTTWLGISAADVGIRLAAQMLSTVVIARLLPAEDFGLALMVLSVVGIMGVFVSLPFEEALTQRQRLTRAHLQSALLVSLAITVGSFSLVLAVAPALARLAKVPDLAIWLPVATLFLLGQGPGTIARALSRRHRRFVNLAACQSTSVILSSAVSVGAALTGCGVFALILQRMLPILLYPLLAGAVACWRSRIVLIRPRWHAARFRELLRFAWLHLTDVAVDYATPAVLTFVVNASFGTAVLGQLNIAMRVVEPLRSAIDSVGHNVAFALLTRLQSEPPRLARAAAEIVVNVTTLAVPAFLGLAVCTPLLLPILVGPGWETAIPLARALYLAAAISVPFRYFYSGFSALGRPEFGLAGSIFGLVVMLIWLEIVARAQFPEAVGTAVIASEAATAVMAVGLLALLVGRSVLGPSLALILRIWIAAGVLVALLSLAFLETGIIGNPILLLAAIVATGLIAYPLLLLVICRPCFRKLRAILFPERNDSHDHLHNV